MCVEKRSKTFKDAADVEDWMVGFVSNTCSFLPHEGSFVAFSIRFDFKIAINN